MLDPRINVATRLSHFSTSVSIWWDAGVPSPHGVSMCLHVGWFLVFSRTPHVARNSGVSNAAARASARRAWRPSLAARPGGSCI